MVLHILKRSTLVRPRLREFQHRLHHLLEQVVAPQALGFQIPVHAALLAGLPQAHRAVEAVDERWRVAVVGGFAEGLGGAAVPGLQAGLAAGTGGCGLVVFAIAFFVIRRLPPCQQIQPPRQVRVRDVAGEGVEDAGAGGRVAQAEVVAVEQVVGGGVVQRRRGLALHGEQAVDDEGHHHAAHVAQELGHRQHAARRVRALHHRVLAEGFQRRAGGGPHEVRPANAGVPEVAQLGGDVGLHLAQHGVVPAGAGGARALPTHQPDELDSEGRIKTRLFLLNG